MPFSIRGSGSNGSNASATSLASSSVTGVQAGDVALVWVTHQGTAGSITVSDGTTSLTAATKRSHDNGDLYGQWFYLLSSVATGSLQYTATYGNSVPFRSIVAFVFAPTGVPTFDTEALSAANANAASMTSGTFDTNTADEIVAAGYANYGGGLPASEQINGAAADAVVDTPNDLGTAFYRILTSTFTGGAATGTISAQVYILNAIAIKSSAGSPSASISPSSSVSASLSPSSSASASLGPAEIIGRTVVCEG